MAAQSYFHASLVWEDPTLFGSFYFALRFTIKPDQEPYAVIDGLPRSPMHSVQLAPCDHPEPRYEAIIQYPFSPDELPLKLRVGFFQPCLVIPRRIGYKEATLGATPESLSHVHAETPKHPGFLKVVTSLWHRKKGTENTSGTMTQQVQRADVNMGLGQGIASWWGPGL